MKTFAVSILVLLGCFGCASEEPTREMAAADDPAHPAGIAHDPVSHVEVRTDSPWKSSWNGTWYYFESQENKMRFDVNPEAYVATDGRAKPERRKVYPHQVQ
jgi:YHS domain-containing protein